MEQQINYRKISIWVLIVLVFISVLVWFLHFYNTGAVIVTTDNPYNSITIIESSNGVAVNTSKKYSGNKKLSVKVRTGQYIISVQGNSAATTQTITVKPHKNQTYNINPINTDGVVPVAYTEAEDIASDNSQLLYLDSNGLLNKIDSANNITTLNDDQSFKTVKWASTSLGVAQDSSSKLYTINNGVVEPLGVPFTYGGEAVNFDVSSDGQIYISYGSSVYIGNASGDFRKIYTSTSLNPVLAAAKSQVAVADTKYESNALSSAKSLLATINSAGKVIKINQESERMAWSPDGHDLFSLNDSNPNIYNASLDKIASIPTSNTVGQFAWLGNQTLLYTINSELWIYNLADQKAELLANMPLGESINSLSVSDDDSYVYVTTYDSYSDDYTIKRVGLKNQNVPQFIYSLQDILPQNKNGYSLDLINFSGTPTIEINLVSGDAPANAQQLAAQDLQGDGFNLSKLDFISKTVNGD